MNWDELFGNAKEQVSAIWDQAVTVGVPVIKAAAEKQLLETVQKQHVETMATVKEVVGSNLSSAEQSTLGQVLKEAGIPAIVEKNKYYILAGVGVLILVGIVLARKG